MNRRSSFFVTPCVSLSLLLIAGMLPNRLSAQDGAEDVVVSYGGQLITVTLPARAQKDAAANAKAAPAARVLRLENASNIELHDAVLVKLTAGSDIQALAARYHLTVAPGPLAGVWELSAVGDVRAAIAAAAALRTEPEVVWVEQVVGAPARLRVVPDDLTPAQWHLKNDGTLFGTVGNDLNVVGAWTAGATGLGVNITVVDSGFDLTHPDLTANLKTALGRDIVSDDADPSAEGSYVASIDEDIEAHGTAVAGVAAARGNNSIGVTGVAYQAGIIPIRLIVGVGISNSQKASALGWRAAATDTVVADRTSVSNNSWGPSDEGIDRGALSDDLSTVEKTALATGVTAGRGGKGVVYVFASGNGRADRGAVSHGSDSADFDGYASNRLVMAIGATNSLAAASGYSEAGVCLFANAPVGDNAGIITTDRQGLDKGFNRDVSPGGDYTLNGSGVIGTSFAAPQAAGVAALILGQNPNLTWRDVRHIIARTAVKVNPTDDTWRTLPVPTGGGPALHWSPLFGFGRIDATAAVAAVAGWTLIPGEVTPLQATASVQQAIPDGSLTGVGGNLTIATNADFRIETVEFAVTVTHADQSQLTYTLTAPSGAKSVVTGRKYDATPARTRVFTSLGHWGENPNGTWRIEVADRTAGTTGSLGGVGLSIFGYRESTPAGNGTTGSGGGTGGLTTTTDPTLVAPTPPAPAPATNSDSGGGGLCGLGSGSVALLLSFMVLVGLRRNARA